jgi:putative ABC transport system permease protein
MMRTWRLVREGVGALLSHRLKTLFMMAGTMLGIASLTVVMAMNDGARQELESNLDRFGSDAIRIRSGGERMRGSGRSETTLKLEDARAIEREIDDVYSVNPTLFIQEADVKHKANSSTALVIGVTAEFEDSNLNEVDRGRPLDQADMDNLSRVCLVGETVKKNIFDDQDPLGKRVMVNRVQFRVVGMLARQGTLPHGLDLDDRILIPLTTAMRRVFRVDYISGITVTSSDPDNIEEQAEAIGELLRLRHHIAPGEEPDFRLVTAAGIAQWRLETVNKLSALLGALAGLCLLVGGVVLMNIMLVSVGERTQEIGLRRSVGASGRDIFLQILTESVVVNFLGMVAGTSLGVGVFLILGRFMPDVPAVFSMRGLVLAVLFSALVGIGFGTLPARRAAALSPVEALR